MMFFIGQGLTILTSATCGALVARKKIGGRPDLKFEEILKGAHHLYLALLLLVLVPVLNAYLTAHPAMHWDLPALVQLHSDAIHYGMVNALLAYVFGFCCFTGFATRERSRRVVLTIAVVALSAVQLQALLKFRADRVELKEVWISPDGVILQSSSHTCAPAAAANIAAMLGLRTTEKELCALFHTTREGTFPAQVLAGMKQLGVSGRKVTLASSNIAALNPPAMLFLVGDGHAVAYAGFTNGSAEIWDPAVGKRRLSTEWLRETWQGHALEFWRDPSERFAK